MADVRTDEAAAATLASAIRELAETAAEVPTVDDVCRVVLNSFLRHFQADGAKLLVTDRDGALHLGLSSGLRPAQPHDRRWIPWPTDSPEPAGPVVIDGTSDLAFGAPAALLDDNLRQAIFVPLMIPGRLVGAVAMYYAEPRPFTPEAAALADALGLQAAVAMYRRRIEASLASRQRMLAHFVEDAPVGLKLVDPASGEIVWANPAELALVGLSEEQYVGRGAHEFFDHGVQRTAVREVLSAAEPFDNLEAALRRSDGSIRHVLLSGRCVSEDDGQMRVCCFTRDISERKRGELEQHFLLESSQILSSSLEYTEILERLTHLPVPDHADWSLLDMAETEGRARLVAVAHRDPEKADVLRALRADYPLQPRNSIAPAVQVMRTGRPILVKTLAPEQAAAYAVDARHLEIIRQLDARTFLTVPLLLRGEAVGTLTWVRTVGRPPLDERDVQLAQELARTAVWAVEHARLYREAQEANRLKDVFLASVSHELRTPLNAITGWASMLAKETPEDAPLRRAVDAIARNAEVQGRLIEDLLDIARIVGGKQRIEMKRLDICEPLLAAIESVKPAAEDRRVEIRVQKDVPEGTVCGDSQRLQQVFWNLLSNAIKFSEAGESVDVRVGRAGGMFEVKVSDAGRGMHPDLLPHIFDPFRQADHKPGKGLGLGLAIVRNLVDMHGGRVTAESPGEGMGATFTVHLPAA